MRYFHVAFQRPKPGTDPAMYRAENDFDRPMYWSVVSKTWHLSYDFPTGHNLFNSPRATEITKVEAAVIVGKIPLIESVL
jgi:hypothetical protein